MLIQANKNKKLNIKVGDNEYLRIPITTHTIMPGDDLFAVIEQYATDYLQEGDILFVAEKIVAISQGRAFPLNSIKPRWFAYFLSKFVTKTPYGIGLGIPETMEMALRECGFFRIFFAAVISAITKIFKRKGDFYRIAGPKARAIDGPTAGTIPPYDNYVVLGPENPSLVATKIKDLFTEKIEVIIVDINDLGGNILGASFNGLDEPFCINILKDNPLGQGKESTPLGIIREVVPEKTA
ncbi:MAG: F420-0--gamma-glutamyl ligase [Firmicutes bacterium]|nr:F420-0--gamma-glutamyl ligase [Bacillota bacterium]